MEEPSTSTGRIYSAGDCTPGTSRAAREDEMMMMILPVQPAEVASASLPPQPNPPPPPPPPPAAGGEPPPLQHVGRWMPGPETGLTDPGPGQTSYAGLFRIVPEDVDFDEPDEYVNPCTTEVVVAEDDKARPFDCYKYMEYHRYQHLLHRFLTIKKRALLNMLPPQPSGGGGLRVPHSAPLNELDEQLKVDFQRRYGPTNFDDDDPVVQKQLKTMRDAYFEMESLMSAEEEDQFWEEMVVEEELDHPILAICEKELLDKIKQKFRAEEMGAYVSPSFLTSAGDWFLLPRPEPFQTRQQNVLKRCAQVDDIDDDGDQVLLTGLHVYDPKFEFSLEPPYLNFYIKNDEIFPEGPTIPKMITVRILELLSTYPNGVSMDHFCQVYQEKHGPFPMFPPLEQMEDVVKLHHPDEIYIARRVMALPDILFDSALKGIITSPEIIVKRVWHAVKAILAQEECLKADEVLPGISKESGGFSFNPSHWGFPTPADFFQYCITQFGEQGIIRIYKQAELCPVANLPFIVDYIMIDSDLLVETHLKGKPGALEMVSIDELRRSCRLLPPGSLSVWESIDAVSNHISRDDIILMQLHTLYEPHQMFGIRRSQVKQRQSFQDQLQADPYLRDIVSNTKAPNPAAIKLNMTMLARLLWNEPNRVWYRVRVIRILPSSSRKTSSASYMVYGIDHGFQKLVPLADLRHLPNNGGGGSSRMATVMAFAVPMKLDVEHPSGKKKARWESASFDTLHKLIGDEKNLLHVEFKRSERSDAFGCLRWTVSCSVVTSSLPPEMVLPDLEIAFMEAYKKVYESRKLSKTTPSTHQRRHKDEVSSSAPASSVVEEEAQKE